MWILLVLLFLIVTWAVYTGNEAFIGTILGVCMIVAIMIALVLNL